MTGVNAHAEEPEGFGGASDKFVAKTEDIRFGGKSGRIFEEKKDVFEGTFRTASRFG